MNKIFKIGFILVILITILTIVKSDYNPIILTIFSLVCNGYLFLSFSKKVNIFHIFMSFFLWMGFWLKFMVGFFFYDLNFYEISNYQVQYNHINRVLIISSIGILGFLISAIINYKFLNFQFNQNKNEIKKKKINYFLLKYKNTILILIIIFVSIIAFLNFKYSIYQRGVISDFNNNFILSAVVKWLLLFGLSSFISILIYHSLLTKKKIGYSIFFISIIENFLSSVSMLSRGMFVNFMAIFVGIIRFNQNNKIKKFYKKLFIITSFFSILFFISIIVVKDLRSEKYFNANSYKSENSNVFKFNVNKNIFQEFIFLLSHRFVGIESVSSVVSYKKLNFELLIKSFKEKDLNLGKDTFFSKIIKKEDIENTQSLKKNIFFIKVPGIIAFLFYSGSYLFLFIATLSIGFILTIFEKIVIKLSFGNIIFTSLISQVFAYRLSNFGYLPSNTYLIVLTVILNILIFYFLYNILNKYILIKK